MTRYPFVPLLLILLCVPMIRAQEDSAFRRAPVPMDSARMALLYVSSRAAERSEGMPRLAASSCAAVA